MYFLLPRKESGLYGMCMLSDPCSAFEPVDAGIEVLTTVSL
jgi:hypothetical protein